METNFMTTKNEVLKKFDNEVASFDTRNDFSEIFFKIYNGQDSIQFSDLEIDNLNEIIYDMQQEFDSLCGKLRFKYMPIIEQLNYKSN